MYKRFPLSLFGPDLGVDGSPYDLLLVSSNQIAGFHVLKIVSHHLSLARYQRVGCAVSVELG